MLSFASAPGNLFNRLGKLGLLVKQAKSYQNAQNTNFTDPVNGAIAQFQGEPDIQAALGSGYIGQLNSPGNSIGGIAQNVAAQIIGRMVYRDNPRYNQSLTNPQTLSSIFEVIRQMGVQGATILNMTITPTVSVSANGGSFTSSTAQATSAGNGVIVVSVKRPFDGLVLENTYGETVLFTCTTDSLSGGAAVGNESFIAQGSGVSSSPFNFDWPAGSNLSSGLTAINGASNNSGGNLLTGSGFDSFVVNVPVGWSVVAGVPGTNIFSENNIVYDGAGALKLTGDGATLVQLTQSLTGQLNTQNQYSIALWLRRDPTAAAAGTLIVDIVDQNNNVIQDENGINNSFSIDLTALTTVYSPFTGVFRTPDDLPSAITFRLRMGTALSNNRSVYIDKLGMGQMTQLARNEPFASIHAGSIPFEAGDFGTVQFTNSRGAGGTLSTWQTFLWQLFPLAAQNEILWPSSSTPTISDGLIG